MSSPPAATSPYLGVLTRSGVVQRMGSCLIRLATSLDLA